MYRTFLLSGIACSVLSETGCPQAQHYRSPLEEVSKFDIDSWKQTTHWTVVHWLCCRLRCHYMSKFYHQRCRSYVFLSPYTSIRTRQQIEQLQIIPVTCAKMKPMSAVLDSWETKLCLNTKYHPDYQMHLTEVMLTTWQRFRMYF